MKNKIFLAPYPFTDSSQEKLRPALCLCEARGDLDLAVFAFITSQEIQDPQPTDIELNPQSDIGRSTRLLRVSTARLHRLFSLNRHRVGREVGEPSPELQREVTNKLRLLFDL